MPRGVSPRGQRIKKFSVPQYVGLSSTEINRRIRMGQWVPADGKQRQPGGRVMDFWYEQTLIEQGVGKLIGKRRMEFLKKKGLEESEDGS